MNWRLRSLRTLLFIFLSALLFAASFPNPVFREGLFFLAFISLIPLAYVLRTVSWGACIPFGLLYGFLTYGLLNYWLVRFHPMTIFIVPGVFAVYFAILLPLLHLSRRAGRWAFLVQTCVWVMYEYLRTLGFLGYSYGIIGYTLWNTPLLIQMAEFGGVWIVSFIVVLPSFFLGQIIFEHGMALFKKKQAWVAVWQTHKWIISAYAVLCIICVGYGVYVQKRGLSDTTWKVALVQQNIDPWQGGTATYEKSLDILIQESEKAIQRDNPDVVVWSETAFVPSISFHTRYRTDAERYGLVKRLEAFMKSHHVPFVIGNSDAYLAQGEDGQLVRKDYNAALVFEAGGKLQKSYRKRHLVPFTEHFPYKQLFPRMHDLLIANDTHFWEEGAEWTVFELGNVSFSTPICFEDTFGYISREFVRNGADVIVNLSNDLWSHSEAGAMQHFAMSVFRAVENRRSVVRSTNGGMTAIIDYRGEILDMYPAFTTGYLAGNVPIYDDITTVYTHAGDWFAYLITVIAIVSLCFCIFVFK